MNRAIIVFLLLLLSCTVIHAQSEAREFLGSIRLPDSAQNLTPAEQEEYIGNRTLIIIGKDADFIEMGALELIKTTNAWLGNAAEADEPAKFGDHIAIILVGGPAHNQMTEAAMPYLNNSADAGSGVIVYYGKINETVIAAITSSQGFVENKALEGGLPYSPLRGLVPEGTEAAAATTISLVLLAIINIIRTVFEFKALDFGRSGKKVGEGALIVKGININEVSALVAASAVLGTSISWQFFGPTLDFVNSILINSAICLMAALIHEITHRVVGRKFGIKVEYRFWKVGSALTLLSSYLGNAFSIQGFVLEEIEPGTERWKLGLMKLSAPLVSALFMILFAILFIFFENPLLKTAYLTSALWAMAEILPLRSLDGDDIRKWNPWIWLGAFIFISVSYVAVVFFL